MPNEATTQTDLRPFTISNDALNDGDVLRERMTRDGYLFFRNLIPTEAIQAARAEILQLCAAAGWLAEGTKTEEGIARPGVTWVEPQPEFMEVYNAVQKGQAFHALALTPPLMTMLQTLFGEEPLAHSRNIARIIFPQNTLFTTPSHQDYIHIQGTKDTYTAWIPLGDCPKEMGSLAVLAGSHREGVLPVHTAYGAGGLGIDTAPLPYDWIGSDFACGDLILFHSLTVHRALPNLSPDRIRLSVDYRYQPLSHPVHQSSMLPHYARLTWEEIYANWQDDRYQFYWRDLPLNYAELDAEVMEVRSAAYAAPPPEEAAS
jgi:ectoine hydroxylase-related dioxygenase (phytanoyl-CoA dioxygenase family)